MILALLALLYDPCRDPDEIADECASEQQHDAEISIRSLILQRADADVCDEYNLAVAYRDAGYPCESMLREVAARCAPDDPVLTFTLDMLAEEVSDPDEAGAIRAQVDYLREIQ